MIELLLQAERALEMGRVDAAETLYRQVADADPAQLDRGRRPRARRARARRRTGALELARRALTIDPENAAASRMVERLEEVIRYRGAEPPAPEAAPETSATPAGSSPAADPAPAALSPAVPSPTAPPPARPDAAPTASKRRSLLDRLLRRGRA